MRLPQTLLRPDARFGRDAHRETYVFGYNVHTLIAATSSGPLPLATACQPASTHDSTMHLIALNTLLFCRKMRLGARRRDPIYGFSGDGAHDASPIYETLAHFGIKPFIPLNSRAARTLPGPLKIDPDDTPICFSGYPMRYYGQDRRRRRLKWRCPVIYGSKKDRARINCQTPCSTSPFGRVIHTKPAWDLRVYCYPPRSSPQWKKTYALRYQSEQMNSRLKNGYLLGNLRSRSRCRIFWSTILADMLTHLTAWVARASLRLVEHLAAP